MTSETFPCQLFFEVSAAIKSENSKLATMVFEPFKFIFLFD